MKKTGRNDPCPCGSGKKFKKCCESKLIGKKFLAQKLDQSSNLAGRVSQLTSFFQTAVSQPSAPAPQKTFKATLPPSKEVPSIPKETPPTNENPPEENKQ